MENTYLRYLQKEMVCYRLYAQGLDRPKDPAAQKGKAVRQRPPKDTRAPTGYI